MKTIFTAVLVAFFTLTAQAAILGQPYIPEIDKRFDAIEQGQKYKQGLYPAGAADGPYAKQIIKGTYNYSVVGGAVGTYALSATLPANAIVTRSYVYSKKQPYGTSTPKLGFYCGSTYNLYNPTNVLSISADGSKAEGTQTGTAASMSVISSACTLTAAITAGVIQSGNVTIYVEYVVNQ